MADDAAIATGVRDIILRQSVHSFIGHPYPEQVTRLATTTGQLVAAAEPSLPGAIKHDYFAVAANVCRRLGDISLYGALIREEAGGSDAWRAAALIGSLVVGYSGSAKSALDAVAIGVNQVFALGLAPKQQDFGKGALLHRLGRKDPAARSRYAAFDQTFKDIIAWRDSSVHRSTPLSVVHSDAEDIDKAKRSDLRVRIASRPDVTISAFPGSDDRHWLSPADFSKRWLLELLDLTSLLESDFRANPPSRGAA